MHWIDEIGNSAAVPIGKEKSLNASFFRCFSRNRSQMIIFIILCIKPKVQSSQRLSSIYLVTLIIVVQQISSNDFFKNIIFSLLASSTEWQLNLLEKSEPRLISHCEHTISVQISDN